MANISHFTQTVNGVSTTYDIHDANAVDLSNNQTVGGIKTFSNAPVVGSINLDGKTIDTDANGDMTFNGDKVLTSAIKEGSINDSGWCLLYGDLLIQWGTTVFNGIGTLNFSKPFSGAPHVVMNYGDTSGYGSPCAIEAGSTTKTYFSATNHSGGGWRCNWIAIGKKGY